MNTQKIQTGTVGTKGFTLVELIVVITILVILGTIAFLNLGGMSASARDSQRTSDLNQINQQIMVQQAKSGLSYMTMVSGTGNTVAPASLAGAAVADVTKYVAGDVGYTVLGIDSAKFKDPSSAIAYKMGATTLAGSAYQIAAKLEEPNTALVMGTYRARTSAGTASAGTISGEIITLTSGFGNFKLNDTLSGSTSGSGVVTGISADLTRVTITGTATGTGFNLTSDESTGLIAKSGTPASPVTNGGTVLPY